MRTINSTTPSYQTSNQATLGDADPGVRFFTGSDGYDYSIDSQGYVYYLDPDSQTWTLDNSVNTVLAQIPGAGTAVAQSTGSTVNWGAIADAISKTVIGVQNGQNQSALTKLNMQRALQGLAPVTALGTVAPGAGLSTNTMLMLGAGALGLILVASRK